jgi:hypothetical protein
MKNLAQGYQALDDVKRLMIAGGLILQLHGS